MKISAPKHTLLGAMLAGFLALASCGSEDDEKTAPVETKPLTEPTQSPMGAALIISTKGEVLVFGQGRSDSREQSFEDGRIPQPKEAINPGSRITTGKDAEVTLLLSNGASATLGPDSDLLIDSFEQQEFEGSNEKVEALEEEVSSSKIKLELDVGELIFKVKKLKKSSSLEISTSLGVAGVRGTQFKVEADQDAVAVAVLSGSVEFVDSKQTTMAIGKQSRMTATKDDPPEQGALPPADHKRIELANMIASKRIAPFTLRKLNAAYQEVNRKQARYDPKTRLEQLLAAGGKESTEVAVKRGLDWLKANQDKDGSWGAQAKDDQGKLKPTDKNAMTGMALLCFLGHGELQDSPDYGATVRKALQFLASSSPLGTNLAKGNTGCYSHAIRTEAICAAYAMTRLKKLEPWAKTAAETIVKGQNESGGWAYGYSKGRTAHVDLSVTGWNVDALKAAALGGLDVNGLDEAMDKAIAYVKRCQDETGKFAYKELRPNSAIGGKASLTGMGVWCLQNWKNARSPEAFKGLDWIIANQAKEWAQVNPYEWHRSAQACFMTRGMSGAQKYWESWNQEFQDIVVDSQNPDGTWPPAAHFHGDLDLFRTTMSIRMLEVYYR
ncbi:MAG: FecR domain-containing protein [Opitutales bacterium]